ncbi:hypothetical protein [Pseudomonas sp. F(2018)]|uniref:hypothetical protein n=1 Tax=Pseudomonas sp. F(2018) TaxID=2502240 RepID=UPI00148562D2|nr:hypothetical protein [Pseudomonas sp. F(2018)]
MFITYRRAEIAYPPLLGEDTQMWRFVEFEEHRPWFYVMVNRRQKAAAWRTMLLIPSEDELEDMLKRRTAGTLIEAIQVVLPARLNGSADWTMERLTELVRVYDQDERVLGYDFTTASGHTYSQRECRHALDAAKHQVYSSSMCSA